VSGRGAGRIAADQAGAHLEASGHSVARFETRRDEGAREAARRAAAGGVHRVLAIGGDGTVTEAAAGILEARRADASVAAALAVVPRGTANVLALNLAIPTGTVAALATALDGRETPIDVGLLEDEPFLLAVSTGFHAEMVARASRAAKRRLGVAAYGLAGWQASREAVPTAYRLTIDGVTEELEGTMIQVMNCGAVFRRSWEFAPGISPVDGRLDVLVYRARTLAEYLATAALVVRGNPLDTALVERRSAVRLEIEADPPARLQRDGETAGATPARVEVLPRALPVLLPPGSPWAA
jgi:YegS/Rv2252/BmrU family lipid kinase